MGEITTCTNDSEFKDELQQRIDSHPPDFVVVVVSGDELPPHLLRYPDLKILVLTTRRKLGSLTPWLQQGACDVATLARPQQVQHALSRLIDECAMTRRVDLLATELLRSEARYATLIRNSRTPLSFWRDNELLACSPGFSAITSMEEGANAEDWLANISLDSNENLGQDLDHWPAMIRARINDQNQPIRIERETSCEGSDDNEHLFSVKLVVAGESDAESVGNLVPTLQPHKQPLNKKSAKSPQKIAAVRHGKRAAKPMSNRNAKVPTLTRAVTNIDLGTANIESTTDSVSGLPARQTVINDFQRWLHAGKDNSRYIAMTVDLSTSGILEDTKSHSSDMSEEAANESQVVEATVSAIDRTLQDLAVYRAADRLSKILSANTLLGRLNNDCLVIIRELEADEAPRMLAKGIRRSLGSLGGLIGSPDAVRINTVNINAQSGASAEGLVTRLENR